MTVQQISPRISIALVFSLAWSSVATAADWSTRGGVPAGVYIWDLASAQDRLFAFGTNPSGTATYAWEIVPGCEGEPDVWVPMEPKPGAATGYYRAITYTDPSDGVQKIYLPGGGLGGSSSSAELAIYTPDGALGTWTLGPDLPMPVNGYAADVFEGEILVATGCCPDRAQLFSFDGYSWSTKPHFVPDPRTHAAGGAVDGRFVLTGGYDWPGVSCDHLSGRVHDYAHASGFGPLSPLAHPRSGHEVVVCGDQLFVIGGVCHAPVLQVEVYDGAANTWSLASPLPSGAGWAAAALHQGRIWLVSAFDVVRSTMVLEIDACAPAVPWPQCTTPPIANAGPDQAGCPDQVFSLDGSASGDTDTVVGMHAPHWSWDFDVSDGVSEDGTGPLVSASYPSPGLYVAQLTFIDDDGEQATDTVTILVEDTEAPVIDCPSDLVWLTGEGDTDCGLHGVLPMPDVTDDCDPSPVLTDDAPMFFPVGDTSVTYRAVDRWGNTSACVQTVTVVDHTPPVVESVSVEAQLWPPNHELVELALGDEIDLRTTDNCGGPLNIVLVGCRSSEPDDGLGDGHTTEDCQLEEDRVRVRRERSGRGAGRTYSIDIEVADAAGNLASVTASIQVDHDRRRGE